MENNEEKKTVRFKSFTNTLNNRLFKFEKSYNNSNYSSLSKKTGAFEENINNIPVGKMNSFSPKRSPKNLHLSIQNNIAIHSSVDFSLKDVCDVNNITTNINISIDNPNFSINNIENFNKTFSKNGTNKINNNVKKESISDLPKPNLISFKGSNIESEYKESENKIISSIYADYLENKSNSEILSDNKKNETKLKKLNEYLEKNKILQYEYNKGIIAGFSAYTYQNEEVFNRDKLSININIDKKGIYKKRNKTIHLINYFSIFCGDKKDKDDDLTKFLKNNFKDILLEEKEIINNPINAIKNSFAKCELKYINYYLKVKNQQKNENEENNNIPKIQNCSIIVILNIDNLFYIGSIGNLITIISSNSSKNIQYLSKENITQEEYDNNIKKKRNSLFSFFNHNNINYINELSNSKVCFNNSKINNCQKDNQNILNIINLNTIYTYNFIRVFPGKKLTEILLKKNKDKNQNQISSGFPPPLNNINNRDIKVNNFMKNENINKKKYNINNNNLIRNRRASLGPFFKISPKSKFYNPTRNYRNSCVQNSSNKTQIIQIISSFPDIISFKYKKNKHDFIFIGCNKIFQKLTNDKICKSIYDTMKKCIKKHRSFELFLGWVIKDIIKMCIEEGITNNISCLFICFNSIKQLYLRQNIDEIKKILVPLCLTYTNKNNYDFYDDLLNANFINVDKANNYYEFIEKQLNIINETNEQINNIFDINLNNKKNDDNIIKIKNVKKRCCCFC